MSFQITRETLGWTLAALLAAFVALTLTGVARGGDLDPSSAPGPSMKTLGEVEPATAITSIPATIDQPGSYYLARPYDGSAVVAIEITASNVTLDLRGFPLIGDGTGTAILAGALTQGVEIRNGTLADWDVGVSLAGSRNTVSGMLITGGRTGITVGAGHVVDNRVLDLTGSGIVLAGGVVRGNVVYGTREYESEGIFVNGTGGTLVERNWVAEPFFGIAARTVGGKSRFQDNHVSGSLDHAYYAQVSPMVFIRNTASPGATAGAFGVVTGGTNVIGCFVIGTEGIAEAANGLCNIAD